VRRLRPFVSLTFALPVATDGVTRRQEQANCRAGRHVLVYGRVWSGPGYVNREVVCSACALIVVQESWRRDAWAKYGSRLTVPKGARDDA
jgi:hypothetical protein